MGLEERYFREELDYLRQLSKLLATEKPHLARFLAEKDADPDIERLLEGVESVQKGHQMMPFYCALRQMLSAISPEL